MISTVLTYLYVILFGFSSCYEMYKGNGMPIWLFILNIGSCILMALKPLSNIWLVTGLILAIVSALLNGWLILGKINLSHVIVRLILSSLIIWLAFSNYWRENQLTFRKERFFRFAEILAYVVEFLFIFAAILFVIGIFALLSGHSSHFLLTIDRRSLPINKVPTTLLWIISGVSLIGMGTFCMIVDSMRHLIHYLAEGRYFVRENLELIKKIMHFFAIVTLMELVGVY